MLGGEDRQKSKASAPGMARHKPPRTGLRRLYCLPVLSVLSTLSLTSADALHQLFLCSISHESFPQTSQLASFASFKLRNSAVMASYINIRPDIT
ncbi:Yersinia protein of uncharacterised function (DUF3831) [Yersinia pekkanenii]|uniref:Yersinia protein of uncharacterized function (DUF3831) n=1 Tax=Yersinia pekkanenii TaxID=1288385 RepID=A0ABM9TST0_9GAMM|nr:Yersinia protein of uncharacterised function (DUF3831) [Yersinia pekkanenii]